ncbi:MAG: SagB/ThcOx family dehydrogenase [Alistipes sp.]|nr:SagB/ThcOx family dehydrogenase [Alistipes sp.]
MKQLILMAAGLLMTACCCNQQPTEVEPVATPVVYEAEIQLPAPDLTRGTTVGEALANRRSWREYSVEQLSLEELSGVLYAAAGINRPETKRLTAPSALALYPIRVYAFFKEGIYRYEAEEHKLVRVKEGNYMAVLGAQPFVAEAALNLVYVADLSVYADKPIPAEKVLYLCGQDAAGYAENVNLYTAGTGLRSITRGSASAELLAVIGLDAAQYAFALAQSVGK